MDDVLISEDGTAKVTRKQKLEGDFSLQIQNEKGEWVNAGTCVDVELFFPQETEELI